VYTWTADKTPDCPVRLRKCRARSDRRSHYKYRLLLRELSARLSPDRSTPQWAFRMRFRWRDRVCPLPERSHRILEGVSTAPGPQAQGRIVDQAGCRLLLRFAPVPRLRERALVVGIPNGVAGGCAVPGDARPHKVQARGQCSSERRAQLLRVFPQVYGEALWRLDRDSASSVSSERRSLTHPSAWKGCSANFALTEF
jgi:hypothetical protein